MDEMDTNASIPVSLKQHFEQRLHQVEQSYRSKLNETQRELHSVRKKLNQLSKKMYKDDRVISPNERKHLNEDCNIPVRIFNPKEKNAADGCFENILTTASSDSDDMYMKSNENINKSAKELYSSDPSMATNTIANFNKNAEHLNGDPMEETTEGGKTGAEPTLVNFARKKKVTTNVNIKNSKSRERE